ncbi:hypothetical protein MMC07_004080 [Pseudocyphellaria aurata]|nr:hypothetical protein [Pseudocyphellaria aurata]
MPDSSFLTSFTSSNFQAWVQDFRANAAQSSKHLSAKDYIRLLAIVGGYCLLRPYLVKLGGRFQASDHEREVDDTEVLSTATSPNVLRGQADVPDDSESEEEVGGATGTDWGRNARRRQRRTIKSIMEAEEKLRAEQEEADSDKEIEEFLRKVID